MGIESWNKSPLIASDERLRYMLDGWRKYHECYIKWC